MSATQLNTGVKSIQALTGGSDSPCEATDGKHPFPSSSQELSLFQDEHMSMRKQDRAENDVFWETSMPLKLLIIVQTYSENISLFNQDPQRCSIFSDEGKLLNCQKNCIPMYTKNTNQ
jgi:hypothetical protein